MKLVSSNNSNNVNTTATITTTSTPKLAAATPTGWMAPGPGAPGGINITLCVYMDITIQQPWKTA